MGMDINAETTRHVIREIKESGLKPAAVAEKTGIPPATLGRRLKGLGAWTATEIYHIAAAIRVSPEALLPRQVPRLAPIAEMEDAA